MGKSLKDLVDYYVNHTFTWSDNDSDKSAVMEASKKQIISDIENQIKKQYKDELVSEARKIVQIEQEQKQIKDIKKLIGETFVFSILSGLSVNQITDLITALKNQDKTNYVIWTFVATAAFVVPAVLILFLSIISQISNISISRGKSNEND